MKHVWDARNLGSHIKTVKRRDKGLGRKRLEGAVESAIRIGRIYAKRKVKRRMLEAVSASKATYGAAIMRLPVATAREAGAIFMKTAMGKGRKHAAPELVNTVVLQGWRMNPIMAENFVALTTARRIMSRRHDLKERAMQVMTLRRNRTDAENVPGPIATLLRAVMGCGAETISDDLVMEFTNGRPPLPIIGGQNKLFKQELQDAICDVELEKLKKRSREGETTIMEEGVYEEPRNFIGHAAVENMNKERIRQGALRSRLAKARAFMQRAKTMRREEGMPYARQACRMMEEDQAEREWSDMYNECERAWKTREEMVKAFDDPEPALGEEEDQVIGLAYETRSSATGQDASGGARPPSAGRGAHAEEIDNMQLEETPTQEEYDLLKYEAEENAKQDLECVQCGMDQEWLHEYDQKKLRADTTGLPTRCDWQLTRALIRGAKDGRPRGEEAAELTEDEQDLLEMILTGAIPTFQRLAAAGLRDKGGRPLSRTCPFCPDQREEDAEHILWQCRAWAKVRERYLDEIEKERKRSLGGRHISHPARWPTAMRRLGIVPQDPELTRKEGELLAEEDGNPRRREAQGEEDDGRVDELWRDGYMQVYTDGGSRNPEHRAIRRAAYGVFYGDGHPWNVAKPLIGRTQTVPRAELRAVLSALEWTNEPVEIILDNKWVVEGVTKVLEGADTSDLTHADIWEKGTGGG